MDVRIPSWAIVGLAGLALLVSPGALADDDVDHDRARELYEHGDIRALDDIMLVARERMPGDIVAVGLLQAGNKWVYRFQIVASDGHRTVVDVDAGAATVIENQGGR